MSESTSHSDASNGSYVVVARRYRPRGFDELVGQEHVGRALKNALETGRVGHAYLFTGARGVGKTSTARIFAKALNDPAGPTATPDSENDIAQAIDAGEDVDVIEIDGASNRGIDEIRSLRANVGVRPSRSRFKIYIIDEVHMLTPAAFNALLKTLEEPPEHVKFIFCTTDPEKIPITVLSRCQRFDFAPVEVPKIVTRLREIVTAESAQADDAALELIARRASGSMRDSQSLLEQVLSFSDGHLTAEQVHAMLGTADDERLHALAKAMADRDAAETLKQMDAGIDAGVDAGRLAEQLLGYFRDLMTVTVGCDPSLMRHTSASLHEELKLLGDRWGLQTVLAVVGLIDQTLVRIRHSVYSRVLLESTLIQICHLPDLQAIADVAAAAATLSPDATSGGTVQAAEKKKGLSDPAGPDSSVAASCRDTADSPANRSPEPKATQPSETQGPSRRERTGLSSDAGPSSNDAVPADATAKHATISNGPASDMVASNGTRPVHSAASAAPRPHFDSRDPAELAAVGQASRSSVRGSAANGVGAVSGSSAPSSAPAASAGQPAEQTGSWGQAAAEQCWAQALDAMDPMTATLVRAIDRIEATANGVKLTFPAEARLAMRRCDMPEHRSEVCSAVARFAGRPVSLELASAPPKSQPRQTAAKAQGKSRMQRMREIEVNPLVKACVELFDAEIVRVDLPRE